MQILRNLINSKVFKLPKFVGLVSQIGLSCIAGVGISPSEEAEPIQRDKIIHLALSVFKDCFCS